MEVINSFAPDRTIDLADTQAIVDAIAQEVWLLCDDRGALNWAWVERYLRGIVEHARLRATDRRFIRRDLPGRDHRGGPATRGGPAAAHANMNGDGAPHRGQRRSRS